MSELLPWAKSERQPPAFRRLGQSQAGSAARLICRGAKLLVMSVQPSSKMCPITVVLALLLAPATSSVALAGDNLAGGEVLKEDPIFIFPERLAEQCIENSTRQDDHHAIRVDRVYVNGNHYVVLVEESSLRPLDDAAILEPADAG